MTFKQFLTEGMIKLPVKLLGKMESQLEETVFSYLRTRLEKAGPSEKDTKLALKLFDEWMKDNHPKVKAKKFDLKTEFVSSKIGDVTIDDLPEKYKKLLDRHTTFNTKPLVLKMRFNSMIDDGTYSSDKNIIELNLDRFKHFDYERLYSFIQKLNEEGLSPAKVNHCEKVVREIFNRLEDGYDRSLGTLHHELTHYIQYKILSRGHEKQIDNSGKSISAAETDKANEEYHSSQIEFDPWIKSIVKDIQSVYKKIKRKYPAYEFRPLVDFLTGAAPRSKANNHVERFETDAFVPTKPYAFFTDLKKVDTKKWKKAIKYLMAELKL
jgi:hypothetical protein